MASVRAWFTTWPVQLGVTRCQTCSGGLSRLLTRTLNMLAAASQVGCTRVPLPDSLTELLPKKSHAAISRPAKLRTAPRVLNIQVLHGIRVLIVLFHHQPVVARRLRWKGHLEVRSRWRRYFLRHFQFRDVLHNSHGAEPPLEGFLRRESSGRQSARVANATSPASCITRLSCRLLARATG